jgi:hypothetical protein
MTLPAKADNLGRLALGIFDSDEDDVCAVRMLCQFESRRAPNTG